MCGTLVQILIGVFAQVEVIRVVSFRSATENLVINVAICKICPATETTGIDMWTKAKEGLSWCAITNTIEVYKWLGRSVLKVVVIVPKLIESALEADVIGVGADSILGGRIVKYVHTGALLSLGLYRSFIVVDELCHVIVNNVNLRLRDRGFTDKGTNALDFGSFDICEAFLKDSSCFEDGDDDVALVRNLPCPQSRW